MSAWRRKLIPKSEALIGVLLTSTGTFARLSVGPLRLANVPVEVNKTPMSASLLGMSFLRQADITTHGDQMTLKWRN